MTVHTLTPDEAVVLDAVEATHLAHWSNLLKAGHTPGFVVGLIESVLEYDPRHGLLMDDCARFGCPVLVHGDTFCSQACRDDDAYACEQQRQAYGYAAGHDVKPGRTP